jgi:hypothetical protein
MTSTANNDLVWGADLRRAIGVCDRALRQWITRGQFPAPDGNVNGRNFWLRSTVEQWRADVTAGKYAQARRPKFPLANGGTIDTSEPSLHRTRKRTSHNTSETP